MARPDAFAVYAEARRLAEALSAAGQAEWAARLTDAIAQGSTSGEILMALRFHLDRLQADTTVPSPPGAEARRIKRLVSRCFSWR